MSWSLRSLKPEPGGSRIKKSTLWTDTAPP
ncbi:hypothetical protein CRUP_014824 [Coryphaenoides rupestris]|nr:hypothetical protein CRUP_014824 [Coryphaenoides rupestris]